MAGNARRRDRGGAVKGERVLDILRERIATHALPPGSKLRENDLSGEFGISRARVRELFGTLERRGLIERIPNRGAVINRLDPRQADELFDVREVLEGLCVRLATENASPATWQTFLDRLGDTTLERIRAGDLTPYIDTIEALRTRTIEVAGNALAASLLADIRDRTHVLIRRILILPGRAEQGLKENRLFVAAMRRGDAEEAERLKRANIRSARAWLTRYQSFVF
jgi:DNA-binding GntR family transcriptional regulator